LHKQKPTSNARSSSKVLKLEQPRRRNTTLATVADVATQVDNKGTGNRFNRWHISTWAASYFDNGTSHLVRSGWQASGLFMAWKSESLLIDLTPD